MTSKCFTPIQSASVPSTRCLLCPSMDLIAVAGIRLLIQRTVSWQRVASSDKYFDALCWSPDGTCLALARTEGGYVLYDLELGMTDEEESFVYQDLGNQKLKDLVWVHVGRPHAGWILTDEEKERELEWKYRSAYLDRAFAFLPPSTYIQGDGELEEIVRKSNHTSKKPLSILCAVTCVESVHLYAHGRYHIATLDCNVVRQIVCSADLAHFSVLQSPSKLSIFSVSAHVNHRYSLQTISALYSSIHDHVRTISEGIPRVLSSWKNTLKPLDSKLDALGVILNNYGIGTTVCSALLQHIFLGKTSEHANALEQFFTGIQMNDQLLVRMEKTLHNGLAGVEAVARAILLGPARSLVYDANELCGLDDQLLPHTRDIRLRTRTLLFSIENLLSQVVEARFRLRDLCGWIRSAASDIKAKGTPPDSVQHDNAKKRRIPEQQLRRVTDYLQQKPHLVNGQSSTEAVICSCVSELIAGNGSGIPLASQDGTSPQSVKTKLFEPEGVSSVMFTLRHVQISMETCFEQPRRFVQQGILKTDINFPIDVLATCAIHSRIGVEMTSCDHHPLIEGAFFPITSSEDNRFSNSRQWTILVRSINLSDGCSGIQIVVIPVGSSDSWVLSRCLSLPINLVINEIGFYGDDGKSSCFSGNAHETDKEGRQALGVLVENDSDLELWLIQYDGITFDVTKTSRSGDMIDARNLEFAMESVVRILPKADETLIDETSDPNVIIARTRSLQISASNVVKSALLLCGSRGVAGIVTQAKSQPTCLALFDLEEDEDDEMDEE